MRATDRRLTAYLSEPYVKKFNDCKIFLQYAQKFRIASQTDNNPIITPGKFDLRVFTRASGLLHPLQ
jgi:hypothetical protein